MTDIKSLKVGDRFYYTGDMANGDSFGEIIEVLQPTNYSPLSYKVRFDDSRFEGDTQISTVTYLSFSTGAGQRFKTMKQYNEERQKSMDYINNYLQSKRS